MTDFRGGYLSEWIQQTEMDDPHPGNFAMPPPASFDDFMRRIRAGDEEAVTDLVRKLEPLIRREVRYRLKDRRLGRLFDSMDICQSVLASFFVRAAHGQYTVESREQLVALLVKMVRNKLASAARRQRQQRRDNRRLSPDGPQELKEVSDKSPSPSEQVSGKELVERFRHSLDSEERELADLRSKGVSWAEIVAQLGGTVEARRSQLTRAIDRVSRELGLDDG
jgi:RNA polymerase sigma-70 factor (ECF subfamily)